MHDATMAERIVVGAALLGATPARDVLARVGPADLTDPRLVPILEAVKALLAEGDQPDPVLVREYLSSKGQTVDAVLLHDLISAVPSAGNAGHYAVALLRLAWRRRIWSAGSRLQQAAAGESDETVADLLISEMQAVDISRRRWMSARGCR